jgi:hypothetical protein
VITFFGANLRLGYLRESNHVSGKNKMRPKPRSKS